MTGGGPTQDVCCIGLARDRIRGKDNAVRLTAEAVIKLLDG
jgi:hypothetical protein